MRAFACSCLFVGFASLGFSATVQWREGFESGAPGWSIEGATWEFGKPTAANGPKVFAGLSVAGTVLAGNYGPTHNARLITPRFAVPAASESPRFSYYYWYQIGANDYGQLQIRVADGPWQDVAGGRLTEAGESWARHSVDLRAYAGQTVQLAFHFVAAFDNRVGDLALGWYIDEVALETGPMALAAPEGFEQGFGDWSVEGGVWQVGPPKVPRGPAPFEGTNVAGTTLTGNYGTTHDARLITPEFAVPPATEVPRFSYHDWYHIGGLDYGQLQVRVSGGPWQDVSGERLTEAAESWARRSVDLRPFAGKTVQIAFRLVARYENRQGDVAAGWFIDDAGLETGPMAMASPEGFEQGFGNWSVEGGVWQVGAPKVTGGPAVFAGSAVAGTALDNSLSTTHDARLVTPEFLVPAITAAPRFSYHHWFSLGGGDYGQLQIRAVGGEWQDVSGEHLVGAGAAWSRRSVDLRPYAGQTVQLGFHFVSTFTGHIGDVGPGWFIDEAKLETGAMSMASPENFESGFGQWSAEGGVWQVGAPTARNGPTAFSGASVAGTILAGNYPDNADARLVSPEFVVPPAQRAPQLEFRHWRAIMNNDRGHVEISVAGGPWTPVGDVVTGSDPTWKRSVVDLTTYAGQPVRVAFHFTSDRFANNAGWYIDDVQLGTVDPASLTLGTPVNGTLPATGARVLYVLDAPPGGHLRFTLDDLDDRGANEIYVRRGAVATAGAYDFRFAAAGADQSVFAPNAGAGPWFVLLVGAEVPAGGSAYRLRADFSKGIALSSMTPSRVGNSSPASLDIAGAGFDSSARVELRSGSSVAATGNTTITGPDKLRADIALTNLAAGNYQVTVTQGANSASLPLEVIAGGHSHFEMNLIVPAVVGRHAPATLFVEYANTGEVAMAAPLVIVRASSRALLTLDPALGGRGLWTAATPAGFSDLVQILAGGATPGILQPGERGRVPVLYAGLQRPWSGNDPVQFQLGAIEASDATPIDWSPMKSAPPPIGMDAEAWQAIVANLAAQFGSTWGAYVKSLGNDANFLSDLGTKTHDVSILNQFALVQAEGFAATPLFASARDVAVPAPGIALTFGRIFPARLSGRYRSGALGRGWAHNWEVSAQKGNDGTVLVHGPGGMVREFQPDERGGFFALPGDHGALTTVGEGRYQLRETDGAITVFRNDGRLDYVQDLNGNRVTASYEGGVLTALNHSNGQSLKFTYANDLIQTVAGPAGGVTQYEYDGTRHLTKVISDGVPIVSYTYASGTRAAREHALTGIAPLGRPARTFNYDDRGRLVADQSGGGAGGIRFDYGSSGMVTTSDAAARKLVRLFNQNGAVAKAIDPLGNFAQASFDPEGNVTVLRNPDGGTINVTYDRAGMPTRVLNALGGAVVLKYGANAAVSAVTDARGNATSFALDRASTVVASSFPDGSRENRTVDGHGQTISTRNARGQTITIARDAAGRIVRRELPEGRTFEYSYDARGKLTKAVDSAAGVTTLAYDGRGLLTSIAYPDGKGLTFTYDEAGRRASRMSRDGDGLKYFYDPAGRLARLEDGAGRKLVTYTYDSTGRLVREERGNGTSTTYTHDAVGRLEQLVNHATDGSVLSRFDYRYGVSGLRTEVRMLAGASEFTHDVDARLTSAKYPGARTVNYSYDAAGNRTAVTENGQTVAYTANALNQYTRIGTATFAYDADGNLASRTDLSGTTTYSYDSENRLMRVVTPGNGRWDFTYDIFGTRSSITHDGITTRYLNDPSGAGNIAAEYDDSSVVARYAQGQGLVARISAAGEASYYDFDLLGNTREVTGPNGAVVHAYDYDVFGKITTESGTLPNPFAFGGRYGVVHDSTGLDHMRARVYAPELGRFVGRDALWLAGPTLNAYTYAGNAPGDFIDPLGLWQAGADLPEDWGSASVGWDSSDPNMYVLSIGTGGGLANSVGVVSDENGIHGVTITPFGGFSFDTHAPTYGPSTNVSYAVGSGESISRYIDANGQERISTEKFHGLGGGVTGQVVVPVFIYFPHSGLGASLKYWWQTHVPFWLRKGDLAEGWRSFLATPKDPNELIGPSGIGAGNYLRGTQSFAYRLNFENDRTATAPAQIVEIANRIPENLDLATLELTSVGFGDIIVPIPAGSRRFEHTEAVTRNGTAIEVVIEVSLDAATRELRAKFSSVLPDSGLPPPVEIGFLPPEDDTGRGKGHVAYIARPRAALPTGTEIRNIGLVTFDRLAGGPTFRTDLSDAHDPKSAPSPARQALVTLDADAPTSKVTALPAEIVAESFVVKWSGTDQGAGIARYDIYAQTDGGAWTRWLAGTSETSASWPGRYGHRYGFLSVATDGVGFSEAAPSANSPAQAQTTTTRPWWMNGWLWGGLATALALLLFGLWRIRSPRRSAIG